MSDQAVIQAPVSDRPENEFESWARSLSEFFVRAALLPVTLFFTKPSKIVEAAESGHYRPLPSPFLLAVITGVIVSGVTSNIDKFNIREVTDQGGGAGSTFLTAVLQFYAEMDGMRAILFAIPYIAVLWLLSGLTSVLMARGIRNADALFASFSLCLSALVEVASVGVVIGHLLQKVSENTVIIVFTAFMVYTIILTVKLVRMIFLIRKMRNSSWLGAILATIPATLVSMIGGLVSGSVLIVALNTTEEVSYVSLAENAMVQQDYAAAIAQYDAALVSNPRDAQAYVQRGRAFEGLGVTSRAIDDYTRAIRYTPAEPNPVQQATQHQAYFQRATALSAIGDYNGAIADFDMLIDLTPFYVEAYNGRCWARAQLGDRLDLALLDCDEALRLIDTAMQAHYGDGAVKAATLDSRGLVHLRQGAFQDAVADYDAALAINSDLHSSTYGRGLAYLRLGNTARAQADLASASAADSTVAAQFAGYGLTPNAPRQAPSPTLPAAPH